MSSSALKVISSVTFLSQVWDEMYTNIPKKKRYRLNSLDKVSADDFNRNKTKNLLRISKQLRAGSYSPSNLKAHFIPKTNSVSDRIICVPTVEDRLVQRAVLFYLNQKGYTLNNEISYGFIKGDGNGLKNALDKALSSRLNNGWCYKADISSFFDRLDRDLLKSVINKKIKSRSLRSLISDFVDCEIKIDTLEEKIKVKKNKIKKGEGLRQGMPISPYLANLYLANFDDIIIRKKIAMIRYADDLIAFCGSSEECSMLDALCRKEASKIGLTIHPISGQEDQKTYICSPTSSAEFLGINIEPSSRSGYKLSIPARKIERMKHEILRYRSLQLCVDQGINMHNLPSVLLSKINGYKAVYSDCWNFRSLENVLNDTFSNVMKSVYLSVGINLVGLSDKERIFLALDSNLKIR